MAGTHKVLDEVVAVLKQNPGLKLSIEGHTSGDASYAANMKLSQDRANRVKSLPGIEGHCGYSRLKAKGFGPNQPLTKWYHRGRKS